MNAEQSPTVRKLRLGIELRRLRIRSGHTMLEAANHVARTDSAVSRMETGQVAISHLVLEKFLDLYGAAPAEREALRILAGEARQRGWWHAYGDALPDGFDIRLGLESEATSIWIYEPEVVPGLLQTEDYARALMYAEPSPSSDDQMRSRLAVRMMRQERMARHDGPAVSVILHEGVLRHEVGGRRTMGEQLQRLVALSSSAHLTLQVLPFSAGAHPAMHVGGFTVLSIPLGGEAMYEIAHLEHRTGALYLDKPAEVDEHKVVYDQLRDKALDREKSRAMIAEAAATMTTDQR